MISNFDAATKLLNNANNRDLTYRDRMNLFFIDYNFMPLLIQVIINQSLINQIGKLLK